MKFPLVSTVKQSRAKAPLILFCVTMTMISACSFLFGVYLRGDGKIEKWEVKRRWVSLMNHLSLLDLCISTKRENITLDPPARNYNTATYIASLPSSRRWKNMIGVEGFISLKYWEENYKSVDKIYLKSSLRNISHTRHAYDLCIQLTGPVHLLPSLKYLPCVDDTNGTELSGYITSVAPRKSNNSDFCPTNTVFGFNYNLSTFHSDLLDVELSKKEKLKLSQILMQISAYVLLFTVLFFLANICSQ